MPASNNGAHQQIKGFTAVPDTQGMKAFTQNHLLLLRIQRPTWDEHGLEQDSGEELCFLLFIFKN